MSTSFISSMFLEPPDSQHALILETLGIPTRARRGKAFTPVSCCQGARSVKISNDNLSFHTGEIKTADGQDLSVLCSATYSIDTSSNATIVKAYKSFPKEHRQVNKCVFASR